MTGQALIERDLTGVQHPRLSSLLDKLRGADAAFTNLECALRGRFGGTSDPLRLNHIAPATVLDTLRYWGFNALALASNHAYDLGPAGILSALEEVAARGLIHAGTGRDLTAATSPGYGHVGGRDIAVIAMTASARPEGAAADNAAADHPAKPGINPLRVADADVNLDDRARNLSAIAEAAAEGRFVLVYLHQHYWAPDPCEVPPWLPPFARDCVAAGASTVVVHGPPRLHGIEVFRGRPLLYGLGNFVFHTSKPDAYPGLAAWESVVTVAHFDESGLLAEVGLVPVVLGRHPCLDITDQELGVPLQPPVEIGVGVLDRLAQLSRPFGSTLDIDRHTGTARLAW